MKVLFELEQRVEVVRTAYKREHLAVGSFGIVKKICPFTGRYSCNRMYELRMDNDAEEGTWPFFGYELKAVE